ncbi:MAG: LLM class F420-dependent oxidoreductase [Acidimicrobiia bacterium]
MKVDGILMADALGGVGRVASEMEALGYDGLLTAEINHDPFYPLLMAAGSTQSAQLATGIAVAFARSPMTVANTAWDLQVYSEGRFFLGLGSQIRPHIEKRFSMPWSHPAARMKEYVLALKAIWESWMTGDRLNFRGDFYQHTLMTPFFSPGLNAFGPPPVAVAAVGAKMTEVAATVADGIFMHGFTTPRYVREVTMPAIEVGLAASGRTRADFTAFAPLFVVTGATEEEMATARAMTCQQIAFYGSTPNYRPVLELHGWGALQDELNRLSKLGEWQKMGDSIDDEILNTIAVVAEPSDVARELHERFGDTVDRLSFYAPYAAHPEVWAGIIDDLHELG